MTDIYDDVEPHPSSCVCGDCAMKLVSVDMERRRETDTCDGSSASPDAVMGVLHAAGLSSDNQHDVSEAFDRLVDNADALSALVRLTGATSGKCKCGKTKNNFFNHAGVIGDLFLNPSGTLNDQHL